MEYQIILLKYENSVAHLAKMCNETNAQIVSFVNHESGTNRNRFEVIFFVMFTIQTISIIWEHIQGKTLLLNSKLKTLFGIVISLLIAAVIVPPTFVILSLFWIHRKLIEVILKAKHGSKFGGLLRGTDSFWAIQDESSNLITILMTVKCSRQANVNIYQRVKRILYEKFFKDGSRYPKMLSSLRYFGGYSYLIQDDVRLQQCVRKMTKEEEEEILMEQVGKYCSSGFDVINRRGLWEAIVGTKPSKTEAEFLYYPIVFRVHHSLSDGIALIKLLVGVLSDKEAISPPESYEFIDSSFIENLIPNFNKVGIRQIVVVLITDVSLKLLKLLKTFRVFLLAPAAMVYEIVTRKPDASILHGAKLSGENVCIMHAEKEAHYVEVIRKIRSRISGVKFSEILLTAVSASFAEYYQKNALCVPESITTVIPAVDYSAAFQNASFSSSNLRNNFSIAMLNLPVQIGPRCDFRTDQPVLNRLEMVRVQTESLRNSFDYVMNFWLLDIVCGLLPESILRRMLHSAHSTMVVSNLPGPKQIKLFEGLVLQDVAFWIPNRGTTGIGLSILSYDGRFQLGLMVDKALIARESEAKEILSGIYETLDRLEVEVNGTL